MSRKSSGLRNPGAILFQASNAAGKHLRDYCYEKGMTIQEGMREALVDYLIKVGEVSSRESLAAEEEMSK
jgi:hypothetical protein